MSNCKSIGFTAFMSRRTYLYNLFPIISGFSCSYVRALLHRACTSRPLFFRCQIRPRIVRRNEATGSAGTPNVPDRATDITQNALAGLGNGLLGYEPRYNRCRWTGFWPRARHALIRNFVTYDRAEQHLRPQLGMYAGAFGAGVIAGTWVPDNPSLIAKGYQGVTTQVVFGMCAN